MLPENTGFEPNPVRTQGTYSRYAGIDDVIEWLHFYMILLNLALVEQLMMLLKKLEIKK